MAKGSCCPCHGWEINKLSCSLFLPRSLLPMLCWFSLTLTFSPFISNSLVQRGLSKLSYEISNRPRVPGSLQPGSCAIFPAEPCSPVRPYQSGAITANLHFIQYLFHCCRFSALLSKGADRKRVHSACSCVYYSFGVLWGFFSTAFIAHQRQVQQRIGRNLNFLQSCHQSRPTMTRFWSLGLIHPNPKLPEILVGRGNQSSSGTGAEPSSFCLQNKSNTPSPGGNARRILNPAWIILTGTSQCGISSLCPRQGKKSIPKSNNMKGKNGFW